MIGVWRWGSLLSQVSSPSQTPSDLTKSMEAKLDNPVWHSLKETHKQYSIDGGNICFYHPDYCPFGGFINSNGIANEIDRYARLTEKFYIVGEKPRFSEKLSMINELVCDQMVIENRIGMDEDETILRIDKDYKDELFNLVNLVQPGYFKPKTSSLGSYYGIFKNGTLVAVTGERMKMNDLTEVSAVVTHPDHTGKGYAKKLVAFTTSKIFDESRIPYLHVSETNTGAISLYNKLGFKLRRKISFWTFIREASLSHP